MPAIRISVLVILCGGRGAKTNQPRKAKCRNNCKGKGRDALCEINIEEIKVQPRLDDTRRHCDGVYAAFCEISSILGE
jgi:hypothetical protein